MVREMYLVVGLAYIGIIIYYLVHLKTVGFDKEYLLDNLAIVFFVTGAYTTTFCIIDIANSLIVHGISTLYFFGSMLVFFRHNTKNTEKVEILEYEKQELETLIKKQAQEIEYLEQNTAT